MAILGRGARRTVRLTDKVFEGSEYFGRGGEFIVRTITTTDGDRIRREHGEESGFHLFDFAVVSWSGIQAADDDGNITDLEVSSKSKHDIYDYHPGLAGRLLLAAQTPDIRDDETKNSDASGSGG